MNAPDISKEGPFIPVILGGDIGAYSLARAAHEAYDTASLVISQTKSHLIADSCILINWVEPDLDRADVFRDTLARVRAAFPGQTLLLLACSDWYVSLIAAHREELERGFVIPYVRPELLSALTKKQRFYELCDELNIPYPETAVVDFSVDTAEDIRAKITALDAGFPLIAKPENSGAYHYARFAGKHKVFTLHDDAEINAWLDTLIDTDYKGKFLVQRFIPGDDSAMRILTTYSNGVGKVVFHATGQTLLEDHDPLGIGNPVAIRTLKDERIVKEAMRLLEHTGYTGFANFDIKVDPNTGQYYFFELNARLGRSNYYVTSRGFNVIAWMVNDLILNQPMERHVSADEVDALFTLLPKSALLDNIADRDLKQTVAAYYESGRAFNPVNNPQEHSLLRRIYPHVFNLRQQRAFAKKVKATMGVGARLGTQATTKPIVESAAESATLAQAEGL